MEKDETFFISQYQSLREEIKDTKARAYRSLTIGFAILPGAEALGAKLQESMFITVVPALIIVFAMLFLSQNHEIMRCGRFIRTCIEPRVQAVPGWETYLESERLCIDVHTNTRTVDRYMIYAFYGLFFIYYLMSSVLAVNWIESHINMKYMSSVVAMIYTAGGIVCATFLNKNLRSATTTDTRSASQTVVGDIMRQLRSDDTN